MRILSKELEEIGFRCDFNTDGSMYFWNSELKIEFIVPEKGRGAAGSQNTRSILVPDTEYILDRTGTH